MSTIALEPYPLRAAYDEQRIRIAERFGDRDRLAAVVVAQSRQPQPASHAPPALAKVTATMLQNDGALLRMTDRHQPRLAPALAFLLGRPLIAGVTPLQAMAAVEAVGPAMVLFDSARVPEAELDDAARVRHNLGCQAAVVGPWVAKDHDLANLGILVCIDGVPTTFGSTAAMLGHPLRGLSAAAGIGAAIETELQDGWLVIVAANTLTPVLAPDAWVDCEIEALGRVSLGIAQ